MTSTELAMCPTMTLQDLCEYFKANLVPANPETMAEYIVAGRFPFAVGLDPPQQGRGQRKLLISRAGAYAWLDAFLQTDTIKI